MASFNSPDQLQQLIEALKGVMGNSRYERPSVSRDAGAEDALKQYETILREETTLRGKFNKTFESGLRGAIKTLAGLPKTLDQVYDQIEAGMRTNNDSINRIQKMTIDSVKANKLNSKQIEKLATETGSMANAISKQTKSFKTNSALEAALKEKERSLNETRLQLMASHNDKTKQEIVAVGETKRKLNEELQTISKNLTSVNEELKVVSDDLKYTTKDLDKSVGDLTKSFNDASKSQLFDMLEDIDQAYIEDMIRTPTQKMSSSVISAMESFEDMSETVQSTLKTLVTQSVNHIRNSMSDMSSKLQRAGAMAIVSGKGILDSYRAQLSANLIESTPVAIAGYGMDASEQADIIKSYARELASISGTNNMSKAYNESVSLADLHKTAQLYGLTGKAAQELALQSVRTVNQMGAAGQSGTETTSTTKALMQQMSSSAAYLQMDKAQFASEYGEEIVAGLHDSRTSSLMAEGKKGADLSKTLLDNITAIKGNTAQLGYSNTYAKELLQNALNKKFGGISELVRDKIAAEAAPQLLGNMLGRTLSDTEISAVKTQQRGGTLSPDQFAAFEKLQSEIGEKRALLVDESIRTGDDSKLMTSGALSTVMRSLGIDIASAEANQTGYRAAMYAKSIEAQTVRDKETGEIISSPVVNADKQAVAAAGNIDSFNNTMTLFEKEFLELAQWAEGISKNPFGNFAGAAIGGIGSLIGSAIGTGLGAWVVGAGGGAAIGAAVSGAITIAGPIVAIAAGIGLLVYTADQIFGSMGTLINWWQEESKREKDDKENNAAKFERRKQREASGTSSLTDIYQQGYEAATGNTLGATDSLSYVNGKLTLNNEVLTDQNDIRKVEDAAYAAMIAATGSKDMLTSAPLEQRSDILRNEEEKYRKWRSEQTKELTESNDALVTAVQGLTVAIDPTKSIPMPSGARRTGGRGRRSPSITPQTDKVLSNGTTSSTSGDSLFPPIAPFAQTAPTATPQTSAVANSIPSVVSQSSLQPAVNGMRVDNLSSPTIPSPTIPSPTITAQTSVMVPANGQIPAGFKQGFDWNNFKDNSIGLRESGGRYNITGGSSGLYSGKYQMGAAALIDAGLMNEGNRDVNDPANWTIPGGREAFLNSPEIQENAYKTYIEKMRGYVSNSLSDNYNIDFDSLPVEDQAGIVAAAHLTGQGAAARLYATGEFSSDAFDTSNKEYYDRARIAQLQSNSKNVSINPTPILTGIQSNVTGSINNNLSNPNSNPNTMWNMMANIMSNGNNSLISGIERLNEGIQTNNKLTGQTANNTNPELNRKSEPEKEKRPDYTSRNRSTVGQAVASVGIGY